MKSRLKLKIFLVFSLALLVAGGWFAKDIMTTDLISVRPTTKVPEIARLLLEHGISAVPLSRRYGTSRRVDQ